MEAGPWIALLSAFGGAFVVSVVVGAILIMVGARIVAGSWAKPISALGATIATTLLGWMAAFVAAAYAPAPDLSGMDLTLGAARQQAAYTRIAILLLWAALVPVVWSAIIRTNDGRRLTYGQSFLILLMQVFVGLVVGAASSTLLRHT